MKIKQPEKGKRYTRSEKEKILAFVDQVNREKGRGGQTAAAKKFGVAALTIGEWQKKDAVSCSTRGDRLRELAELEDKIAAMMKEKDEILEELSLR